MAAGPAAAAAGLPGTSLGSVGSALREAAFAPVVVGGIGPASNGGPGPGGAGGGLGGNGGSGPLLGDGGPPFDTGNPRSISAIFNSKIAAFSSLRSPTACPSRPASRCSAPACSASSCIRRPRRSG